MAEGKQWLSTGDVASRFEVTPAAVRAWIKKGQLPAVTLPSGRFQVRESDVEKILSPTTSPDSGGDGQS